MGSTRREQGNQLFTGHEQRDLLSRDGARVGTSPWMGTRHWGQMLRKAAKLLRMELNRMNNLVWDVIEREVLEGALRH